jgi:hypothetical protein
MQYEYDPRPIARCRTCSRPYSRRAFDALGEHRRENVDGRVRVCSWCRCGDLVAATFPYERTEREAFAGARLAGVYAFDRDDVNTRSARFVAACGLAALVIIAACVLVAP